MPKGISRVGDSRKGNADTVFVSSAVSGYDRTVNTTTAIKDLRIITCPFLEGIYRIHSDIVNSLSLKQNYISLQDSIQCSEEFGWNFTNGFFYGPGQLRLTTWSEISGLFKWEEIGESSGDIVSRSGATCHWGDLKISSMGRLG